MKVRASTTGDRARRRRPLLVQLIDGALTWGMARFDGPDGTLLTYHRIGLGMPLVCLPGGPMRASAYLGDLGGLSAHRSLILLDLRGTGESAVPTDPATYRCDHLVADVEALRLVLGLERIDLLAHSAGAALGLLYAHAHPDRIGRLALITPSPRPIGLEISDLDRRQVVELRRDEPWFPQAFAAFERIWGGSPTPADWADITAFTYGRWDAAARDHAGRETSQKNQGAAAMYFSDGALNPQTVLAACAQVRSQVLLLAGEYDVVLPPDGAAKYAERFPHCELFVQPGAGHFPWLDDPTLFVRALAKHLA